MARITVEDCMQNVDNLFELVLIASKRARQLSNGAPTDLEWENDIIEGMYQVAGFIISGLVIWYGMRRGWADVVNTGNVFFVIFLYTKLFDWWWEIMPKYLFFLVIGLFSVLLLFIFKRLRDAGFISIRGASK